MTGRRRAALAGLLVALAAGASANGQLPGPPVDSAGEELALSSTLKIRVRHGRAIELHALPRRGDGYAALARRLTGSADLAAAVSEWNGAKPLSPDRFIRIPLGLLSDEFRSLVLLNLFPKDRRDGADWLHIAREGLLSTYDEGLWQVAEWFTGDGSRFEEIQRANGLPAPEVKAGQVIRIPAGLLHPALRALPRSDDGLLEYGSDDQGPWAGYRLQKGEALYSAVVVRFTGRTSAEDVNAVAGDLAKRSGIDDLTDIPVLYRVKIPLDVLEPEHLPREDPRRKKADAAREELAKALAEKPVETTRGGLEGVLVILDPGHGGRDLGTMHNGIWEHDYVYDVACRLKARLEEKTHAEVRMTLEDLETGFRPIDRDRLKANHQGTVKTHPPYRAKEKGEAAIAVNLRWYLANSIYRHEVKNGRKRDRIVFLSLHADARHASLRGVMAYAPGAPYRAKTYGHNTKFYRKFREVREKPRVKFSHKQRVRSEAVSTKLANSMVRAFRKEKLPVQPYKPVRNRVIRGRRAWIPAVLRSNEVPAKVLVEMVNLKNASDAKLLTKVETRDRLADALLRGLYDYFGEKPPQTSPAKRASR